MGWQAWVAIQHFFAKLNLIIDFDSKQAWAELGQAQIKLELGFTLMILLN